MKGNTTIQISKETREELNMLFSDKLDYNEKIRQLIRVCPDVALITLNNIKKEMDLTGKGYLETISGFLARNDKSMKIVVKLLGGEKEVIKPLVR